MNKYIFTAIALAAVAVGCTKSDLVDTPAYQTPISFETYTGKTPVTKASTETTSTLQAYTSSEEYAFHVSAYEPGDYTGTPYMDEDVWYENAKWEYEGTRYWPASGGLHFFAYRGTLNKVDNSYTQFTYNVDEKASKQEDLIVAYNKDADSAPSDGKVSLVFEHLLSRVGFTLQTTKASTENLPINVTIKHIELQGEFYPTANVDLTTGTLSLPQDATPSTTSYSLFDTTYPLAEGEDEYHWSYLPSPGENGTGIFANKTTNENGTTDKEGASEDNRYMMLIPEGKVTGAKVIYQIDNSAEVVATATLDEATTLVQGNAYEFIIRLSTDAIEFSGAIVPWEPAETPIQ